MASDTDSHPGGAEVRGYFRKLRWFLTSEVNIKTIGINFALGLVIAAIVWRFGGG